METRSLQANPKTMLLHLELPAPVTELAALMPMPVAELAALMLATTASIDTDVAEGATDFGTLSPAQISAPSSYAPCEPCLEAVGNFTGRSLHGSLPTTG